MLVFTSDRQGGLGDTGVPSEDVLLPHKLVQRVSDQTENGCETATFLQGLVGTCVRVITATGFSVLS